MDYWCLLHNETVEGQKIIDVEYTGNSFQGTVVVTLEDKTTRTIINQRTGKTKNEYRPSRKTIQLFIDGKLEGVKGCLILN